MINVDLNYAQRRMAADRLLLSASGEDFDPTTASSVWVNPITEDISLLPGFMEAAWFTSNTGIYQKLAMSNYTLENSSEWEEVEDDVMAGTWYYLPDSEASNYAITTALLSRNQGMYIALFVPGLGTNGNNEKIRFGFNSTADASSGWGFVVKFNGEVDVYHNGNFKVTGQLGTGEGGNNVGNQILEIALIPYRQRDILVYSPSHGGGFYVTNESITEDDTSPDIHGTTNFWFKVINGVTKVTTATIKYNTSGTIDTQLLSFFEPPVFSDTVETYDNPLFGGTLDHFIYGDPSYVANDTIDVAVYDENGSVFNPDGIKVKARLRATLSSDDNAYSPFLYGLLFSYGARYRTTSNEPIDITQHIINMDISVGEGPEQVIIDASVIDPLTIPISELQVKEYLPFRLEEDGLVWFEGLTKVDNYDPNFVEPYKSQIDFEVPNLWEMLEAYRFVDPMPVDGRALTDVLTSIIELSGIDLAYIDIEPNTFIIPYVPGETSGEFANLIKVGDTAAEWVSKLLDDYTNFEYYGFRPTASGTIFYAHSDSYIGETPHVTLYDNINDAINIGGHSSVEARRYVYRSFEEVPLKLEANDIRVTGWNPRLRQIIHVHKSDLASQEPTTAELARPENWLGFIKRFGILDQRFNTDELCERVCNFFYNRLTQKYYVAEIECELLRDINNVPLWRGDVVHLYNLNKTYRINTFDCTFLKEFDDKQFRSSHYTLKRPLTLAQE